MNDTGVLYLIMTNFCKTKIVTVFTDQIQPDCIDGVFVFVCDM